MKSALWTMALSAILCGLPTSSFAIPYASQIRAETTIIAPGTGTQISYYLNEPADSVTINLSDEVTTVATFAGPATRGYNSIRWNGTKDNDAGAAITHGELRITVTATKSHATWTEIAGNGSTDMIPPLGTLHRQLFPGFTPNDCLFITDRTNDFFGIGITNISNSSPRLAAAVAVQSDLSTQDSSDGFESRLFRAQALEDIAQNQSLWGMSDDPDDSNLFYFGGQTEGNGNLLWRGDIRSSATLTSADPDNFLQEISPRGIKVVHEDAAKFVYLCSSMDLYKAPMDHTTNIVSGPPVLATNFATRNRYARGVDTDSAGNVYFISKKISSGKGGALFRWNTNFTNGANPALTEALAAWKIECPDTMLNMMGPAITPNGDVYVAMISGGESDKLTGIFYVGNTATQTILRSLSPADCVVDFTEIGQPSTLWNASTLTFNLRSDPVGNLIAIDRETRQIRIFSPPGSFTIPVTAPASQTIRIGAGIDRWSLY